MSEDEKKAVELDDEILDEIAGGDWVSDEEKEKAIKYVSNLFEGSDSVKACRADMVYRLVNCSSSKYTFDQFKAAFEKL